MLSFRTIKVVCRSTDPLLPALVEGLCLVHAIPVAPEVAAIPEVSILVAKVAAVPTSLIKLLEESEGIITFFCFFF